MTWEKMVQGFPRVEELEHGAIERLIQRANAMVSPKSRGGGRS